MRNFYIGGDCSAIENPNEELLVESKNGNFTGVEFILKHCNGTDINTQDIYHTGLGLGLARSSCFRAFGPFGLFQKLSGFRFRAFNSFSIEGSD